MRLGFQTPRVGVTRVAPISIPRSPYIMTDTALTGATYDVDGGRQLVAG